MDTQNKEKTAEERFSELYSILVSETGLQIMAMPVLAPTGDGHFTITVQLSLVKHEKPETSQPENPENGNSTHSTTADSK